MTKLDRLRWLLVNTEVEEDIPAIAELIRAEELREAKAFMESRDLTELKHNPVVPINIMHPTSNDESVCCTPPFHSLNR